jgi:hypothetical protein
MTQNRNLSILADTVSSAGILNPAGGGTGIASTPANGQIPIGNGTNYTAATITAGTGISVTNGAGTIQIANTLTSGITVGTSQATTSGTSFTFTGVPTTAKQITINFNQTILASADSYLIQVGTSGGITTSGYYGSAVKYGTGVAGVFGATWGTNTGMVFTYGSTYTTYPQAGTITLNYMGSNVWAIHGILTTTDPAGTTTQALFAAGVVTTSAALDRIKITTSSGSTAFNGGSVNIAYQ